MLPSHSVQAFVWIIAVAMFGVRLGGVHLHLCFDGQRPPASLHVQHEDGHNDYQHSDGCHQDQDVDLLAQGIFKKVDFYGLDVPGGDFAVSVALLPQAEIAPEQLASIRPTGPPRYLLPPLRGPPV